MDAARVKVPSRFHFYEVRISQRRTEGENGISVGRQKCANIDWVTSLVRPRVPPRHIINFSAQVVSCLRDALLVSQDSCSTVGWDWTHPPNVFLPRNSRRRGRFYPWRSRFVFSYPRGSEKMCAATFTVREQFRTIFLIFRWAGVGGEAAVADGRG